MTLKKNDFIEIKFTGKTEEGEVFDSNIEGDLKEINKQRQAQGQKPVEAKPFRFALGQNMFLKGIDDFLTGKEVKKFPESFSVRLKPEEAFGKRNRELVQMMPLRTFREHGINPVQGVSFNFDGRPGKVLTVSGGRVVVDFNHILAGKSVKYKIEVLRKLEKDEEKVKALNEFFFRKEIPFEIKNKKLVFDFKDLEPQFKQIAKMFKDKYSEILGFEVEMPGEEEKTDGERKNKETEKSKENSGKESNPDKKSQ